jgi:uncharacterized protein YoaH (UPF0181 family)
MLDPVDSARKSLESAVKDFAIDGKSSEEAARFVAAQLSDMEANEVRTPRSVAVSGEKI